MCGTVLTILTRLWTLGILAAGSIALCATAVEAATYRVFLDNVFVSTFEAPDAGGLVSGLSIARAGVTFDTPDPFDPTGVPQYRPATNDFSGPLDAIFANFYNSAASGGCAALSCVLFFEKINNGARVWGSLNTTSFENLGFGNYSISPIPLPAAAPLFAAAVAGAGLVGWVKKRSRTRTIAAA